VYGIAHQAGGAVTLRSELGRGTTVDVYLPPVREVVEERNVFEAEPPRGNETVLLVEDNDDVRTITGTVLKRLGYTVLSAPDGAHALDLAVRHGGAIDLVLTDTIMPGMSGLAVAEKLAEIRPTTRVLFMSAHTEDSVLRHGVERAKVAFLQKPFSVAELAFKVRGTLDKPR